MENQVFFDEIRSWRQPVFFIIPIGPGILATLGGWLVFRAFIDHNAPLAPRIVIGSTFGAGFLVLFTWITATLIWRLIQPPCRVRLASDGVLLGQRSLPWSQILSIQFEFTGNVVWLRIKTLDPKCRSFLLPGPALPYSIWSRLHDQLRHFFKQAGLNIPVEMVKKGMR